MKELATIDNISALFKQGDDGFKTITSEKFADIEKGMVECNRSLSALAKRNTQTDLKLRTLTMLSIGSPYRTIRQIMAQISTKQSALQENYFNLLEKKENANRISDSTDALDMIKYDRLKCEINSSSVAFEAALKDIGMLQTAYNEICESNNIPDNWDEADMEADEISHNIKGAFRNCIRDIVATGKPGHGTQEWFEQFGIHPIEAYKFCIAYVNSDKHSYKGFISFLNEMAELHKDNYKEVMKTIGLKTLVDAKWLYTT